MVKHFISITQVSRENKLREFQFKCLHRIVVTKKELCRFGIKDDSECLYCGEQDFASPGHNCSQPLEHCNKKQLTKETNSLSKTSLAKLNKKFLSKLQTLDVQRH